MKLEGGGKRERRGERKRGGEKEREKEKERERESNDEAKRQRGKGKTDNFFLNKLIAMSSTCLSKLVIPIDGFHGLLSRSLRASLIPSPPKPVCIICSINAGHCMEKRKRKRKRKRGRERCLINHSTI